MTNTPKKSLLDGELKFGRSKGLWFEQNEKAETNREEVIKEKELSAAEKVQLEEFWPVVVRQLDAKGYCYVKFLELVDGNGDLRFRLVYNTADNSGVVFIADNAEVLVTTFKEGEDDSSHREVRSAIQRAIALEEVDSYDKSNLYFADIKSAVLSSELVETIKQLDTLLRSEWNAAKQEYVTTSFEKLGEFEREFVLCQFSKALKNRLMLEKDYPLKAYELKTDGGRYLEFEMDEEGESNREALEKDLSSGEKAQLADYWCNVEGILEYSTVELSTTDIFDQNDALAFRIFYSYIDGRIYKGDTTEIVGYCCQHRPDYIEGHIQDSFRVERALQNDGGLSDICFADFDDKKDFDDLCNEMGEQRDSNSEALQKMSEWLDSEFAPRSWNQEQKLEFYELFILLSASDQNELLNFLVVAIQERRLSLTEHPLLSIV